MLAGMFVVYEGEPHQVCRLDGAPVGYVNWGGRRVTYTMWKVGTDPKDWRNWTRKDDPTAAEVPLTQPCPVCERRAGHTACIELGYCMNIEADATKAAEAQRAAVAERVDRAEVEHATHRTY